MPRTLPPLPSEYIPLASTGTYTNLTVSALNRLRQQNFGDEALRLFRFAPETGETLVWELSENWGARRVVSITDAGTRDAGAWQFQIKAEDDWQVSQDYMLQIVSLTVGTRRWKVKKVETPLGNFSFWKIKAEIQ